MLSIINSFGLNGLNGYKINVEVDVNKGLPSYDVVGLADTAIKESKQRVVSAIKNQGFLFPIEKLVINLAPANTKKEGSFYDLPIAVGLLSATNQITMPKAFLNDFSFLGELSLDGSIRRINGLLPMLITARELGIKKILIPYDNQKEASFIDGIEVYAVKNLKEVVLFLNGEKQLIPITKLDFDIIKSNFSSTKDFNQVKGQASAKRALEICAAGGHNVLMIGPPGSGKTMLARAFPTILPDLTFDEAIESTKIHSVAGVLDSKKGFISSRPFRAPHHTSTTVSLTGGGNKAKPGEVSLAHNGVLFLDEMPEYSRASIEALRQSLEDGSITISRNAQTVEYPANFILIASMNPCPCGNYGSTTKQCKCSPSQISKYLNKISGPIMDRIDLYIEVDSVEYDDLKSTAEEESSAQIKSRVDRARTVQTNRYKGSGIYSNSKMDNNHIKNYCKLSSECEQILKLAFENLNLSARAYNRILKVSRTIADLDGNTEILPEHIAEAISYRSLDEKYWI